MQQLLSNKMTFSLVFLAVILGDFLGISQISPTINYNYLNSSLLYMAIGLLFAYCAQGPTNPSDEKTGAQKPQWLLLPLLAGMCMGFDFFVKFSSSLLLLLTGGLFVLSQNGQAPWRQRLLPVMTMILGYWLGMGVFFLAVYPFDAWTANFTRSLHEQTGGTHSPLRIFSKQFNDLFKRVGRDLLFYYSVPLLVLFLLTKKFLRTGQPGGSRWGLIVPMTLLLGGWMAFKLYTFTNFRFHTLTWLSVILTLLVVHLALGNPGVLKPGKTLAAMTLLLFFPFLLVLGSDASFSYSAPLYFVPWFGLILMLVLQLPAGRLRVATAVTLVLMAQAQFVMGYLYFPWRWVENRLAQTEPIDNVPGLEGIQVDARSRDFIVQSRLVAAQAPPEARGLILGFYNLAGPVYWLGGQSPGLPWYSANKREQEAICQVLGRVDSAALKQALVLVQDEISPKLSPCLQKLGLNLAHYRALGSVYNPYARKPLVFYARKPHE